MMTLATWRFVQDSDRRWRWKRMRGDEVQFESGVSFPDRMSCVMNAVRYVVNVRRK
jgi:hypothetical protein